ncbi:hypothetical protein ABZS29_36510 [Kribbella sp. NPDC005582]|uniref:hypothetical protein n=1 Tax=Kribbella sp. NPDC005582 TaxID=3156893 RepID=UPI0033B5EEF4
MSTSDNVFVDAAVEELAGWLPGVLGARPLTADWLTEQQRLFVVAAESPDRELSLLLSPNEYGDAEPEPEPEDFSAIDGYPADLQVRLVGPRDDETQQRECRAVFERLVAARPDVPMLLVNNLDTLIAAHLPEAGTHYFDKSITPDDPDIETWRPWVRLPAGGS